MAAIWNIARRDIDIPKNSPNTLLIEKHKEFIMNYSKNRESYVNFFKFFIFTFLQEYTMAEYLRMSGLYWCVASLDICGALELADKEFILNFVQENQNSDGGFAASQDHDSHILHTLCAIQVILSSIY